MSDFYRNNYVIRGEQGRRVINTNDIIAEKMQASVEQQKQREQIEKQIAALEAKIRKEKQPKKKFELYQAEEILKERLKNV